MSATKLSAMIAVLCLHVIIVQPPTVWIVPPPRCVRGVTIVHVWNATKSGHVYNAKKSFVTIVKALLILTAVELIAMDASLLILGQEVLTLPYLTSCCRLCYEISYSEKLKKTTCSCYASV